jgi:hypothetical protein
MVIELDDDKSILINLLKILVKWVLKHPLFLV